MMFQHNKLSQWKRPWKRFKNGNYKCPAKKVVKWFTEPHNTIHSVTVGARTKIALTVFNPGSRTHIKVWLKRLFDIDSPTYTAKGNPKWSADVFKNLIKLEEDEGVKHSLGIMATYLSNVKAAGFLYQGENAIMKLYNEDTHSLHGSVDTLGAATTGRMSASKPNIQQVPSGEEFRELFTHREGDVLIGADLSNIEIRLLAHFLEPYDGGVYIDKVLSRDMHWYHAQVAGLGPDEDYDEHNPQHVTARKQAKALVFGINYGSSVNVIGYNLWFEGCLGVFTESEYLEAEKRLLKRVIVLDGVSYFPIKKDELILYTDELILKSIYGSRVVGIFKSKLDGYKDLLSALDDESRRTGYTTIIDGRQLASAGATSKLNYLLQGTASVVTKKWIINFHVMCEEQGLVFRDDYYQCAVIHDELIITARPHIADKIAELLEASANKVTEDYGFKITIEAEAKQGRSWYSIH